MINFKKNSGLAFRALLLMLPFTNFIFAQFDVKVRINSRITLERKDVLITLPLKQLKSGQFKSLTVTDGGKVLPYQLEDSDGNGKPDNLLVLTDFMPREKKYLRIQLNPK